MRRYYAVACDGLNESFQSCANGPQWDRIAMAAFSRCDLGSLWYILANLVRPPIRLVIRVVRRAVPTAWRACQCRECEVVEGQQSRPMVAAGSALLQDLLDHAQSDHFTLAWVAGSLQRQSFGTVVFLLAVAAGMMPGVAMVAGPVLLVPAIQMLVGYPTPMFPRCIAAPPLATSRLEAVLRRGLPLLRVVVTAVRPRLRLPQAITRRIVGLMVPLLTVRLVLSPIPLSNILPAALIALVSLGYLEDDGLIVVVGLSASAFVLGLDAETPLR
jgi:hypothetical protein